jgi:hypothetical protein
VSILRQVVGRGIENVLHHWGQYRPGSCIGRGRSVGLVEAIYFINIAFMALFVFATPGS